jgi:hypothetical protein
MDNVNKPAEIVEVFNEKFKKVFDDENSQGNVFLKGEKINKIKINVNDSIHKIYDFNTVSGITSINTCIDCDGLHSNHFKFAYEAIKGFLSKLFSSFLLHGYMPNSMLRGEIRPIIKDKLDCLSDSNNYRPITISTSCLKIFEYCIYENLYNSLILDPNQFGFQKHTSTIMAITVLKETVKSYNREGSKVYAAFLDLSKAFDKVNHNILMYKIMKTGVAPDIVNVLLHMYENQYVNVSFNGSFGDTWRLKNGVRQGGIISPLLFNFYINEILSKLRKMPIGCRLGIYNHNVQAYADDLTLLAPSAHALQMLINEIFIMLTDLNLTLNVKKSVCMVFGNKNNVFINVSINGRKMDRVDSYKYLGVMLSSNLLNKEDILRSENSFLRQFYSIFRRFKFAERSVMLFLFKSHCLSLYGSELWYDLTGCKGVFNSHAINYHKSVKKMIGAPWRESNHVVCEETGLPIFKHLINWKIISFAFNLMNTKSTSLARHKCFLIHGSEMFKVIRNIFSTTYSIADVFDNDIDAIKIRIGYVQEREERSRQAF